MIFHQLKYIYHPSPPPKSPLPSLKEAELQEDMLVEILLEIGLPNPFVQPTKGGASRWKREGC